MIILTGKADSYAQFITVLFIFVAVLAVTALVTKWIAGYQKQQGAAGNIEVRETVRIANNKYIQLVRIGESYFAIAVCKDTVTALGQIPAEQLKGKIHWKVLPGSGNYWNVRRRKRIRERSLMQV